MLLPFRPLPPAALPVSAARALTKHEIQVGDLARLNGDAATAGGLSSLTRGQRSSHALAAAQSQAASLRQQSTSIDGRTRFMQAQTSLLRSTGGFGADISSTTLNLFA